jgi:hypothetical protein
LRYFYERNAQATSQRGKNGSSAKISDVKRDLKQAHGLMQQQVNSNLTYLLDKGWIVEQTVEKTFSVRGGTVPSSVSWYKISSAGIDHLEGESEFKPAPRFSGINITATGQNVITLGDGNVVNAKYTALHSELERLRAAVVAAPDLAEADKLEVVANVETIKTQLALEKPDRSIMAKLWPAIEATVTLAGFVDLVNRIGPMIAPLLSP